MADVDIPKDVQLIVDRYLRDTYDISRRYVTTKKFYLALVLGLVLSLPLAIINPIMTYMVAPVLFLYLLFLFSDIERKPEHSLLIDFRRHKNKILTSLLLYYGFMIPLGLLLPLVGHTLLLAVLGILGLSIYFAVGQLLYGEFYKEMKAKVRVRLVEEERKIEATTLIKYFVAIIVGLLAAYTVLQFSPLLEKYSIPVIPIAILTMITATLYFIGLTSRMEVTDKYLFYMKAIAELAQGMRMRLLVGENSLLAFLGALKEATHPFLIELRKQIEPQLELNVPVTSLKYELPPDFPEELIPKLRFVIETANDPQSTALRKLEGFVESIRESIRIRELASTSLISSVKQSAYITKFLGPAILGLAVAILKLMQEATRSLIPTKGQDISALSNLGVGNFGFKLNIDPKMVTFMFYADFILVFALVLAAEYLMTYLIYKDKKIFLKNVFSSYTLAVLIVISVFIAVLQMLTPMMASK